MFNFNGENDMKKPLFDEIQRDIIRNKIDCPTYRNYAFLRIVREIERSVAAAIMGLNELKERIEDGNNKG